MAGPAAQSLPPGPRMPTALQTLGWWARPTSFMERCRERYGHRFTIKLTAQQPFVMISDPDELKQVFTAPADVLLPGEGARILEPIVGPNSVLLLDGKAHLAQRRLVLPAFHGERMAALEDVIAEVTREQIALWPRGQQVIMHPRLQALTLEVILRTVFGLRTGDRLDGLRKTLTEMLDFGLSPLSLLPPAQRAPFGRGPWAGFVRARARADELVYAEIAERRAAGDDDRGDVMSIFLAATHEDGEPMSDVEVHDELMTLLVAGHETTATELAWAIERLAREPEVLARLIDEVSSGDDGAYMTAVIRETLRRRPVLTNAAPRTVHKPIEVGGFHYEPGVHLVPSAYLVQHDPAIYPDPYSFRPERFLDSDPGTYTWIPFGGGRRRCVGASFAMLEMAIVLRELLRGTDILPVGAAPERTRRRAITVTPADGAETVLRRRIPEAEREPAAA